MKKHHSISYFSLNHEEINVHIMTYLGVDRGIRRQYFLGRQTSLTAGQTKKQTAMLITCLVNQSCRDTSLLSAFLDFISKGLASRSWRQLPY